MSVLRSLCLAAAGVVLFGGAPVRAEPAPLQDVTLAVPAFSLTFSANYIAEDLGLWTAHGLRVKSIQIAGVGTMNAVISGSTDFGQTSGTSLTRAAAHGQRAVAILQTLDRPMVQVAFRKELADAEGFDPAAPLEQRARLLRGRTIAVESINSIIHAYVRLLARRGGFDPEEIRVAVMKSDNMLAAFAAKQIDGFAMSPPWPQKPVLEGTAVMLASGPDGDPRDMWPFAGSIIVAKPETCEKRRAICDAMGHAFADAVAVIRDRPEEALAVLRKRFATLDEKLLRAGFESIRKISTYPPEATRESLENADRFNIDAGLMKPTDKLGSYDGLATGEFVH